MYFQKDLEKEGNNPALDGSAVTSANIASLVSGNEIETSENDSGEDGSSLDESNRASLESNGEIITEDQDDQLLESDVVEEVVEEEELFLPGGEPSRPHQNIFTQGAYNWDGAAIYSTFTEGQILTAETDEDSDNIVMAVNPDVQPDVGRIDGQTGWTGVNVFGDKTMSYQIAIILQAGQDENGNDYSLSDMLAVNRDEGKATQVGWWIPSRGENDPPEKWTMNLADIYLTTNVNDTEIDMRQTIWERGLYAEEGSTVEGYIEEYNLVTQETIETHNISRWTFDANGVLDTYAETENTILDKSSYFEPIKEKTTITSNQLVIALEG